MHNIKEYLPLYLGCEVSREHKDRNEKFYEYGKLVGISASEVEKGRIVAIINVGIDHFHEWYVEETIPHLRRLSSMSEEEKKIAHDIYYNDKIELLAIMDVAHFELCRYLLSKGFWLFGDDWFTEGLIIDRDTLK